MFRANPYFVDTIHQTDLADEVAREGWAILDFDPECVNDDDLLEAIAEVGTPLPQDAAGTLVWHVRLDPQAAVKPQAARSLTLDEFPFHTDGSFEDPQPRYVALYAVREDRLGGGESQLKRVASILAALAPDDRRVLAERRLRHRVPEEFRKDVAYRDLPLVYGDGLLRYRPELIDRTRCEAAELRALTNLEAAVDAAPTIKLRLRRGEMLVVDNARRATRADADSRSRTPFAANSRAGR